MEPSRPVGGQSMLFYYNKRNNEAGPVNVAPPVGEGFYSQLLNDEVT